jgi:hypothetical protein
MLSSIGVGTFSMLQGLYHTAVQLLISRITGQVGTGPSLVMLLEQNETFAVASAPLRGTLRSLVGELFEEDWFRGVRNLRLNRLPKLKSLLRRYPSELETTIGHNELHRASPKAFSKTVPVKVPDPLVRQGAAPVPKFGERQPRDYSLIRIQDAGPWIERPNLSRLRPSAWLVE